MGRVLGPTNLLSGGVMTGTNTLQSKPMDLLSMPFAAFEAIWTGAPTGVFTIMGSIDGVTYYDTGMVPAVNPAGAPGSTLFNLNGVGFRYALLQYVNAAGVGSLDVNGMAKAGGGA